MHSTSVASWCSRPSLSSSGTGTSPQGKPQEVLPGVSLIITTHPFARHFKVPLMRIQNSLIWEALWGSAALLPHLAHPATSGSCPRPLGREFLISSFPESAGHCSTRTQNLLSEKMTHRLIPFSKTPVAAIPAAVLHVLPALPLKWKQKAPEGTRAIRKKEVGNYSSIIDSSGIKKT